MRQRTQGSTDSSQSELAREITKHVITSFREGGAELPTEAGVLCYQTVLDVLTGADGRGSEQSRREISGTSEVPYQDEAHELKKLLLKTEGTLRALEDDFLRVVASLTKCLKLATGPSPTAEIDTHLSRLALMERQTPPEFGEILRCADTLADILFKQSLQDLPRDAAAELEDRTPEQAERHDRFRLEIELCYERDRAEKLERVNQFLAETIREITNENERLEEVNSRVADLIAAVESGQVSKQELDSLITQIGDHIKNLVQKFKDTTQRTAKQLLSLEEDLETARKEKEKKIVQLERRLSAAEREARTDELTGVANRRWFDEMICSMMRGFDRRRPFSLLLIDIDRFKKVNDEHGHQFGDTVLKKAASVARDSFRRTDTVARYGGEEFAVLLTEAGLAEAVEAAEKLRARIGEMSLRYRLMKKKGRRLVQTDTVVECKITVSVGVATAQCDDDPTSLIRRADAALYLAKNSGRNACRSEADLQRDASMEN